MKKIFLTIAVTVFIAGTMLTGCQSSESKVENAQAKVAEANDNAVAAQKELDQAIKDTIQLFRKESEDRIAANEKDIAVFRAKIARENKEIRARDEQRLAELEQKNRELRSRLEEFREDSKANWESFRNKFNRDMEEHAKAFRDFWSKK